MNKKSWEKVVALIQKRGVIKLADLNQEFGPVDTLPFLQGISPDSDEVRIFERGNETWVDIDTENFQYLIPLSLLELIEVQHLITVVPNQYALDQKVITNIQQKISDNDQIKAVMQLLNQLDQHDVLTSEKHQQILQDLDSAVEQKSLVHLTISTGKTYAVYPSRILHLEGKLSLVAEDSQDHCLTVIALNEIREVVNLGTDASQIASTFEVEEFIAAIRAMNEREMRLIIKIHDHQSVNLFPEHQFLGKPCMVTNPNGDLIWAAYVEPCEALYEWLMELGKNVEILDPVKFKEEYLTYCEEKLSKIA